MTKTTAALHSGWATDPGLLRERNEDRVWADDATHAYLVVDGLGGHAGGELAAQTACDVIVRELVSEPPGDPEIAIRSAIAAANNEIFAIAQNDPANTGMACVLTLALIQDDAVTVGHVGDSRLYLLWNGTVRKLTSDHSPVGEQEDGGELTETEAMQHPRRNEIFRDVGSRERTAMDSGFVDVRSFPFHPRAALLLCTDGLSDALTSAEIGAVVDTYNGDPAVIAGELVKAANDRGGHDNVSVVFVPGPDFIGVNSEAMSEARSRHAITRLRGARKSRLNRILGRGLWLILGIILGMALLAGIEQIWATRGWWLR
jgi:serine/threonine protein phosphatase PrpC